MHRKLSVWRLSVQPVAKTSTKWRRYGTHTTISLCRNPESYVIGIEYITLMSHDHQDVLNHRQINYLWKANIKHQILLYWPFMRGIHWWPVISPYKWPAIWITFPCHYVITITPWHKRLLTLLSLRSTEVGRCSFELFWWTCSVIDQQPHV